MIGFGVYEELLSMPACASWQEAPALQSGGYCFAARQCAQFARGDAAAAQQRGGEHGSAKGDAAERERGGRSPWRQRRAEQRSSAALGQDERRGHARERKSNARGAARGHGRAGGAAHGARAQQGGRRERGDAGAGGAGRAEAPAQARR